MRSFYCHCRFCHRSETDHDRVIKYGTRHYAHFKCYLEAGRKIEHLSEYQVGRFPALLLKEHGLFEIALAIIGGVRGEKLFAQKLAELKEGKS